MNHCSITQVPRGQQKVLLSCEIHTSFFLKLVVPFEQNVISLLFSCLVGCKMARICIGLAQEKIIIFLTGGIVLSEFQRIPLFCN